MYRKDQADHEMISMIQSEKEGYLKTCEDYEMRIMNQIVPKDVDDNKGIVVEVRTGTGGDEASLFASELFRMYEKYCSLKGWKWDLISISKTEIGGFKEAQASVRASGDSVYKYFKYESGVHRVQRIPSNDTKIQTSAASVIILPEGIYMKLHFLFPLCTILNLSNCYSLYCIQLRKSILN